MLKRYLLIAFLVLLFWYPVLFNNNFFYDDWDFIDHFKQGPSLGYFFAPHNEHFMPMFKAIFYFMYNIYGMNIFPYISLLIVFHIINVCLFCYLATLIFPKSRYLPFVLTLFILSNSAYFEVLHWFTLLSIALPFFFFEMTLIYLHRFKQTGKKKYLMVSVISSFFMPMNFLLGMAGILFIFLYHFTIIEKSFNSNKLKKSWAYLSYYLAAWLISVFIYVIFTGNRVCQSGIRFNLPRVLENVIAGFSGFFIKSAGIGILMHPINIWVAAVLVFNFVFFCFFLFLYLVLNHKKERIGLFKEKNLVIFSLFSATAGYLIIALGRSDLSAETFLNWGRYQYFPVFFLTLFIGAIIPPVIEIFSKLFNPKRFKFYLIFLLILYLLGQLVIIRQKAESSVRLEGRISCELYG